MKDLNQELSKRYKEILGENAITTPFGEGGLSMPLLIKFADETAVETADLRVMFFGQETREWTDTGTVDDIMEKYRQCFNDFSGLPGQGPFWSVLSKMKEKIKEQLPEKNVSLIWNNIVKADYSQNDLEGYKVPNEIYAKFRDINRDLILSEIEVLKPHVLIFFTGGVSRDYVIDDVFNNGKGINDKNEYFKKDIDIDGNKNILAKAFLPTYGEFYITYHPLGLQLKGQKITDFVLDEISKQCAKKIQP